MREHDFTYIIRNELKKTFGDYADEIFNKSELLQYLNDKTISANKGSKSRGSFANLYALYVLVEDYINKGYLENDKNKYKEYEGAAFSVLMKRQRELPFGTKLQNHALNSRMNGEFKKYFPLCEQEPIIRDLGSQRYWINENLLQIEIKKRLYNIAPAIIAVINKYVEAKQSAFKRFVTQCRKLQCVDKEDADGISDFLLSLIAPDMDARLFEIVSFAILKREYADKTIYWGFSKIELHEETLKLYKTGRTNANDGGIDFVMKPLGKFFQATETLDFKKYFLDIDKTEHYPVTFVIKSDKDIENIRETIKDNAMKTYVIDKVVENYMNCIEEIINIPQLTSMVSKMSPDALKDVLNEIITQSKIEFNQ